MSIEVTIDTSKIEKFFYGKSKSFFSFAKKNIAAASWAFIRFITLEQLSGRVSKNFGVNVITGTLRRSFKATTIGGANEGDIVTKIYSTAVYADYLQNPRDINRKKLFIFERYQEIGLKLYREAVHESIKQTVATA